MKPDSKLFESEIKLKVVFPVILKISDVQILLKKAEENNTYKNMYI